MRKLTNQIAPFDIEFRTDKGMFLRRDPRVFAKKKLGKCIYLWLKINTLYNETQLHRSGMILKEFALKKYNKINALCAKDQPAFKMASVHL